jgi:hypothetical protein
VSPSQAAALDALVQRCRPLGQQQSRRQQKGPLSEEAGLGEAKKNSAISSSLASS